MDYLNAKYDFLGNVTWYSLPSNLLVNLSELETFREELDPLIKLPKKPSKVNLFKRACKEAGWKDGGIKYFFTNEIKTSTGICRYFTEQYKADDGTITNHTKGKATLTSDGEIILESLSDSFPSIWEKAEAMILSAMNMQNFVDHMAVRSVIKDVLENKMKAVWLNSGTYFVKSEYDLSVVKNIVDSIGGEMEFVPLVNNPQQRSMLCSGYSRMVYNIEEEFSEKLANLSDKPSAFKVEQLKKMIEEVKYLQNEISNLGFTFTTGQYMEYMLDEKLS
jgi:hypothetical protein